MGQEVAVAGPNTYSAQAGAQAASLGGNAVDVALGAMIAALVSEPGIASLGGGGFVTVAPPGGPAVTIDGSVSMPGTGLAPERFSRGLVPLHLEYGGGTDLDIGHGSVATPGTLMALETAHRQFGRIPWAEVVAPAAELARTGFRIGAAAGHYLGYAAEPLFGRDPAAAAVLSNPDGGRRRAGDTMCLTELADFLDLVSKEGASALHQGEVAQALAAEMAGHDGLITQADLAGYRAVVRPALTARIGDWRWATNPAPAVGGPVLVAMLLLLAGSGTSGTSGKRLPGLTELIEVQRAVLADRIRRLDLAPDRIAAAELMLAELGAGAGSGVSALGGSPSTVHVSTVDASGLACAVTASSGYGAGVSVPGTGIWLNNCLGERELNRLGPHALAPGERLVSNMTPTVGRHDDGRVLAIGSPGADRITTAILQVLLALMAGEPLESAIERPRVHVSLDAAGTPVTVDYEADLPLGDGAAGTNRPAPDLRWREHPRQAMFFGGVAAAQRHPDGRLEAAADPRREGAVQVL
jgi:gamma-glutamyltranspeptidase/glutathione hydrolase